MTLAASFPMPQKVEAVVSEQRYAKFIAAPFQSGFGHTIGNSLRRVLLSSMEGSAISAVRIDGASHEFASLPNVVEDITDIVLNLKNVRLSLHGDAAKTLEIRKDKAGTVTAGDIITDGTVEVLNPEQVICTLDKNVPFRAEIDVVKGKGYLPVEKAGAARTIGTIPIDCLFSPVTRVNYHVGAARVGEETEMDSLEIEIWTDGSITPEDALENAAGILKDHLQVFLGGQPVEMSPWDMMSDEDLKVFKLLSQNVDTLEFSVRSMNCLNNANIKLIGELCTKTESKLLKFRNFGKKSLDEIKDKMNELGLSLGMTFSDTLMAALEHESAKVRLEPEEEQEEK